MFAPARERLLPHLDNLDFPTWLLCDVRYMYFAFYLYGVTLALLVLDKTTLVWSVLLENGVLNYVEVEKHDEDEVVVTNELLTLLSLSSLMNELSLPLSLCALWYLSEERLDSHACSLSVSSHSSIMYLFRLDRLACFFFLLSLVSVVFDLFDYCLPRVFVGLPLCLSFA